MNGRRWMFLGVAVDVLTEPGAPVVVAEATLPDGASPPLHVHAGLDDSFYVLEGRMVVRCGDEVSIAQPGSWVQFPTGVPHTFRVVGGPARLLLAHQNDSFLRAVEQLGTERRAADAPTTEGGPSPEELDRLLAAHGITNVGGAMEDHDARRWIDALT